MIAMDSGKLLLFKNRKILSSALIDIGTTASQIGSRAWVTPPSAGSRAESLLAGADVSEPGFSGVVSALSAGTDGFHALARVLRMPEQFGPAIATLARSCIETLGRGWWLLEAISPLELELRAAVLHLEEVRIALLRGVTIERRLPDGSSLAIPDPLGDAEARVHAVSQRANLLAPRPPGYSALAKAIMTAAGVADPSAEYSFLSGAAHGEALVIGSHSVPKAGPPGTSTLGLTIRNARLILWTLIHVVDVFIMRLIDDWGIQAERERWINSRERALHTFQVLFDQMDAAPDS